MIDIELQIKQLAMKMCPDYPGIESCGWAERLYAMEMAFDGVCMANEDLHRGLAKLQKRMGINVHQAIEIMKED